MANLPNNLSPEIYKDSAYAKLEKSKKALNKLMMLLVNIQKGIYLTINEWRIKNERIKRNRMPKVFRKLCKQ